MAETVKKKVLIIDDNVMVSALFQDELDALYDVTICPTGVQGVQAAVAAPPDAILLDVNLPDLNGLQVLQYLAAYPQSASVPVIIITASEYNDENISYAGQFPNFKLFMSKMSGGDALREALAKLLGQPK